MAIIGVFLLFFFLDKVGVLLEFAFLLLVTLLIAKDLVVGVKLFEVSRVDLLEHFLDVGQFLESEVATEPVVVEEDLLASGRVLHRRVDQLLLQFFVLHELGLLLDFIILTLLIEGASSFLLP